MMIRTGLIATMLVVSGGLAAGHARAQDVPGIEICTVEKDMTRRTSCLQSNVDFLKKSMTQALLDGQRKLDAATRQIEALKNAVAALQKTVGELQAAQKKPESPTKHDAKDDAKDAGNGAAKGGAEGPKK